MVQAESSETWIEGKWLRTILKTTSMWSAQIFRNDSGLFMIYPFVENTLKNQGLLLKVPFLWWQLASKRPKKLLRFNSYKIRRQMKKKRKNMKNWENLNYKTQNDKFWTTHRLSLILKICFALKMLKVNKKYSNRSRTIKLTLRKHRYELLISIQSLGFFLLMNRIALSFSKTIICSTSCWMKRFL